MGDDELGDAGVDFDVLGAPECRCDICDVYGPGACDYDDPNFDPESI